MTRTNLFIAFLIYIVLTNCSCKKFVAVDPPTTALVGVTVFSDNSSASSALSGLFQSMAANGSVTGGANGISGILGLSADEFNLFPGASSAVLPQAYTNSLQSNTAPAFWSDLYNYIYQANAALEGITNSTGVRSPIREQLIGEAKFVRAFCHFYLLNIYGDVPLITSTDYRVNSLVSRSSKETVYAQIIEDLKDAQNFLSKNYLNAIGATVNDRVRPNKGAATALLARAYLYRGDWTNAEIQSSDVINNIVGAYSLNTTANINNTFLKGSAETIWQLERPNTGFNTADAGAFQLSALGGPSSFNPYILSDSLVRAFEANDKRAVLGNWISSVVVSGKTYYFPFKYKLHNTGAAPAEYPILLRFAEQFLIRAEARAHLGNILGSQSDLNAIRNRAALPNTTASTESSLLAAIEQERRFELFTEYGHRWLDLKRTNRVDPVMSIVSPLKGGVWNTNYQLYPIPLTEIQRNSNLTQNPGYN